jgi:indolepyruvate ferredoxin oxidoreductase beta subunit
MEDLMVESILICGVGGQGTLLAGDVIARVALQYGLDVKKSEIHGMAQRGGSVISTVRFGKKVYSPIIGWGEADIILAFEKLEALRNLPYLKKNGTCIVNDYEINPMSVASGVQKYPENVIENIKKLVKKVVVIDGESLAINAGSIKTMNVVLLGRLARELEFPKDMWLSVIESRVPEKTIQMNREGFLSGFSSGNSSV